MVNAAQEQIMGNRVSSDQEIQFHNIKEISRAISQTRAYANIPDFHGRACWWERVTR